MSLTLLAIIAGALLGATRWVTAERIAANQQARDARLVQTLLSHLPDAEQSHELCRKRTRGYAGTIELIIANATNAETPPQGQTILGARVVRHSETPGIGDFIETDHSDWILGFGGRRRSADKATTLIIWSTDLDAVVGATITRNAVIRAVAEGCPP